MISDRSVIVGVLLVFVLSGQLVAQPPYDLRPPAEFETHEGMIIGWFYLGSYGASADTMWARAVEAIGEVGTAYVALRSSGGISYITNFLQSLSISLDNVEFIATGTMVSVWVRDYGTGFAYREDGTRVVVEGGYEQAFPQYIANLWGLEHYHVPLSLQGGNYMSDGSSEIAISSAPVGNPTIWQQRVRAYYDLPLHTLPWLQNEPCGHIDMYARFVAPRKVVLSQYASTYYNYNMDLAAAEFEARGYEVYRVLTPPVISTMIPEDAMADPSLLHLPPGSKAPTGGLWDVFRTYTNGIQCNGRYLLPVYNHEYDQQAIDVFQAALPDHEIIPINCNRIIQYGGALHCTSSDIPPTAPARPGHLTITAVGDDAVLAWTGSPIGVSEYHVFRRAAPLGFQEHLDEYVASVSGTSWTDSGVLSGCATVVYQVLAVSTNDVRSVLSSRSGGSSFDLSTLY